MTQDLHVSQAGFARQAQDFGFAAGCLVRNDGTKDDWSIVREGSNDSEPGVEVRHTRSVEEVEWEVSAVNFDPAIQAVLLERLDHLVVWAGALALVHYLAVDRTVDADCISRPMKKYLGRVHWGSQAQEGATIDQIADSDPDRSLEEEEVEEEEAKALRANSQLAN